MDGQAHAGEAVASNIAAEPTPAASSSPAGVQEIGQKAGQRVERTITQPNAPKTEIQQKQAAQTEPVAYIKATASMTPAVLALSEEKLRREVRAAFSDWAMAAVKGDWQKHTSFYADRVEYFRDGSMTRSKVEARKRGIFGKLDSYWLRFSDSPQIVLKNSADKSDGKSGVQEADVTFDRSWTLRRGRKQTSGRAQGVITMRREARGWRIVSEKQIKK